MDRARAGDVLMGIVNVTPDSFSDGGRFLKAERAIARGLELAADGATILDIGGESSRPGHAPVTAEEEIRRVEPVIAGLALRTDAPLSIDSTKPEVAARALELGACVVNDIWGLQGEPAMARIAAGAGAAVVAMHNRAEKDAGLDVAADMETFFARTLAIAEAAGLPKSRLLLDPGVGFGKTPEQEWQALAALPKLRARFGLPILVGLSRKSFLGRLTGLPLDRRIAPTIAIDLAMRRLGASVFRVHDAAEHVAAFKVQDAMDAAMDAATAAAVGGAGA
ncbi:MAG: dihydropteroate synthase [Hyphomicrobiales bacterium]|nr:dihydropteroate synthase [Hyphomicrobiales bacterium]